MKKILFLAIVSLGLPAWALPTYEPFTEYTSAISATGTNAIDLAMGGYSAPGGESWGSLNFSGTFGTGQKGWDVQVTNNAATVFTSATLASLLPGGFPGSGQNIQVTAFIPTNSANGNYVGNSAVLKFAQDVTRPASGTRTIFVSYLLNVTTTGNMGTGNNGRYSAFLAATNLVEGTNTPGGVAYTNWASEFNTFPGPSYISYGFKTQTANSSYYVGPSDSSGGNSGSVGTLHSAINTADFVVAAYVFTAGGAIKDTNILWLDPATSTFGGAVPPSSSAAAYTCSTVMSDVGGFCLESRPGLNTSGGIGPTFIGNLLIGSTWSYVTGGPEFTNQPTAGTNVNLGQNLTLTGNATAAAQSVSYRWQKISAVATNNLSDGTGTAGGTGTVSGSGTSTLTITGVSAGDTGVYQLVATASGTSYSLTSSQASVGLTDPQIISNPANASSYYGGTVSFTGQVSTANAPLTYQWYKGPTPLNNGIQSDGTSATGASGTTSTGANFLLTLTLNGVSYQDIGNYTLYVTNASNLAVTTIAGALSVADPYIGSQPSGPSVATGGNATFTVAATGSSTLSYQWYENGTALSDGGTTVGGSATVGGSQTSILTLTGVSDPDNGSYYCVVNGSASGQSTNSATVVLTVQDPLVLGAAPVSRVERVGDHLAFTIGVSGGGPDFQWLQNGVPLAGATNSALILTDIQPVNGGTYSVIVSNLLTQPQTNSATLTVVNSTVLPLYSTNILVARLGDGAQVLSAATGNTLYLDQYTPAGTYVSTVQIPDETAGAPYGTGSSGSAGTSPALIFQGNGTDSPLGALLTTSGGNQEYVGFAGYCLGYPFHGSDVTVGSTGGAYWRGAGLINAYGTYSLAYTNTGLYSQGNHTIRSTVTLDGTNFWSTGQANANGVKFGSSAVTSYANGSGVPTITSSATGSAVVQFVNSNLFFSDFFNGAPGLYTSAGAPEPASFGVAASTQILGTGNGSYPIDFAVSPDTNTIYIADGLSGIERWDFSSGGYNLSYTIQINPNTLYGASSLAVDFSAASTWGPGVNGAKIYATTYGNSSNSLVYLVDNGASSTPAIVLTVGGNNALRGVRFGPAVVPPGFSTQPQSTPAVSGSAVTLSAGAGGSGPFTYQWYFQAGGVGSFNALAGATNAIYSIASFGNANSGNYYVIATSPSSATAQSQTASVTLAAAPYFTSESLLSGGGGFQLYFTGTSGVAYSIHTTTNLSLPRSTWSLVTAGNLSGGNDTYIDPNGGANQQQFYIITSP